MLLVLTTYLFQQGYIFTPREWQQEDFLDEAQHVLTTLNVMPEDEEDGKKVYRVKPVHAMYMF
ncbi:hypothetical protein GSI_05385 [Ganoderma sinense ZZ0214-1]|uniref:Uncharacterized protein n=1 Tax=Ganoderma sinense ZZ0214-1 TaxID=1077348 RepID=A0A2G8SG03_9APHY|nr:hypothetical protein GSI_05385 [Ganoderma sinense ZZ0214-1]